MRLIVCLCLCILLVSTSAGANEQRGIAFRPKAPTGGEIKGELWLLTIGINTYLSWPQLKSAVNDVRAVKDVLLKRYHLDPTRIIELTDDKATRHNILAAFRELAKKVKPDDSLLIYYAGHGHVDPITGMGSWIPVESGTDDPTAWIDNRNITDYLNVNVIKAKHVLMVSDSCFSGDFFRGNRGALPTIDDAFLKKAYQRSSRQAISSGGLEPVSDAGFGGNSVFSHFFVGALNNNSKEYLIPSEIFGEIKAGVGKNADQLPQYGDLHGVGGQDGGELILFLKQENRLNDLFTESATSQKELEQLRQMEQEAVRAKQTEQAEIAKKEAELATLDRQIAEMKSRMGNGAARNSDSLDHIIAMAEQKEVWGNRLEELRRQREAEEKKRIQEISRLNNHSSAKRAAQIKTDLAKYEKVASSRYAQDMKRSAWRSLVVSYPEAKAVAMGDTKGFLTALGLVSQVTKEPVTGVEFVQVEGGCFQMGDTFGDGYEWEKPVHEVCVNDFRIGKYEVTQGLWKRVMGNNPSHFSYCGDDCPVEMVSWNDVQEFLQKFSLLTGKNYRLPTEAEWEYAARSGGKHEKFSGSDKVDPIGWYSGNSGLKTYTVGAKLPNGLGIYDMSGNVWEWVSDWYQEDYYNWTTCKNDPAGPSEGDGSYRVARGGGWGNVAESVRAAYRYADSPDVRSYALGFRLASPTQ